MKLALVLHAHLPWVHDEPWSPFERWFHEALWECYLPLLEVFERMPGVVTLSVSPPLMCMLADPILKRRFEQHLDASSDLCERIQPSHDGEALRFYAARVAAARATWQRIGGDLLGAWRRLHVAGRIELTTTAVSHAYLPALSAIDGAVAAQLALGRAAFEALVSVSPRGRWLPECALDDAVDEALAAEDVSHTFADAHAAQFSEPRVDAPVLYSPRGVAYLTRDREASHRVWSRERGYPAHGAYREFHRDVGFEVDVGPFGRGTMTGLKLHRIDGGPYDPVAAAGRAAHDAEDFAGWLRSRDDVVIAAYDCELFGHWWLEGPSFLEALLQHSDTLVPASRVLEHSWPVAKPAPSSWGRGGYAHPWMNSGLWRHLHAVHRAVAQTAIDIDDDGPRGAARDAAIRELLLMQASDWLFMMDEGKLADYARGRFEGHAARALAWVDVARGVSREGIAEPSRFLTALDSEPRLGFLGARAGAGVRGGALP